MKEYDCVEVIVEKEEYADHGVHRGMHGIICYNKCEDGYWLVNFPRYGPKDDIAEISIHEDDMKVVPFMNVQESEAIFNRFPPPTKPGW